jgi:hypothetical protein
LLEVVLVEMHLLAMALAVVAVARAAYCIHQLEL